MSAGRRLTDTAYWDGYWAAHVAELPAEIKRETSGQQVRAILHVFDSHMPRGESLSVLEVGGSPGQYLAYIHRLTGCRSAILDFSPVGCDLARRNFAQLGIPLETHERDLFAPATPEIGRFDVVYSLGLAEHFDELDSVVAAQAALVAPGGLLILGMPNFRGVNGWFAKRLDRTRYLTHNVDSMRMERWDTFEDRLDLDRIYRGCIGGFEPLTFVVTNADVPRRWLPLHLAARVLYELVKLVPMVRRFDHPAISGYLMGVWRVP